MININNILHSLQQQHTFLLYKTMPISESRKASMKAYRQSCPGYKQMQLKAQRAFIRAHPMYKQQVNARNRTIVAMSRRYIQLQEIVARHATNTDTDTQSTLTYEQKYNELLTAITPPIELPSLSIANESTV